MIKINNAIFYSGKEQQRRIKISFRQWGVDNEFSFKNTEFKVLMRYTSEYNKQVHGSGTQKRELN